MTPQNKYTYDEVLKASIEYFHGDKLAATTWMNKYALKSTEDCEGEIVEVYHELTPDDMHRRLAKEFARIESNYPNPLTEDAIYNYFKEFKYIIPQGSPMAGIGNDESIQSISNCFVIGNEKHPDSYGAIFKIDQELVQLCKRRGGVGTDLSDLRPATAEVTNAAKTSSGVVSFMERYSNSVREVAQLGRRGALMLSISVKHPDAEDFINAKLDTTKITGANVSVKITDEFMRCVRDEAYFTQIFPIDELESEVIDPNLDWKEGMLYKGLKPGTYFRKINAKKLWDKLIYNAWKSGEPGILFWDTMINGSASDVYKESGFETVCTNPCLTGDTLVYLPATNETIPIADLVDRKVPFEVQGAVKTADGSKIEYPYASATAFYTGDKEVIRVTLSDGSTFKCTPDHRLALQDLSYVEAKDSLGKELLASNKVFVTNIDPCGIEKVYDLTVPSTHNFAIIAKLESSLGSAIIVHNCGELPLPAYDSCRLMAINLYSFVDNPFTSEAKFNGNKFNEVVVTAQRLMDDMIDLELEKIDKILEKIDSDPEDDVIKFTERQLWLNIRNKARLGRRTGLGVTAEGDMLAALGLTYGSEEGIAMSTNIHMTFALASYQSSIMLAMQRGAFPAYDKKLDKSPFLTRILGNLTGDLIKIYGKHGRRNIATMTLAPTGSVSILTQTTSGIEPAFRITYKRRRKTTDPSKAVFTDKTGDMFEEYRVFHHKFIEWFRRYHLTIETPEGLPMISFEYAQKMLESQSDEQIQQLIEASPYHQSTAGDINWVSKVEMQGEIQKWIDHSISCTVNVPNETTVEQVDDIYKTAWSSGCKGVTIYREGSRDGVLISEQLPKKDVRPPVLDAKIIRFKNGTENWISFIGLRNGKPWELFTGKVDDDIKYLPKSIEAGKIIKVSNPEDPTLNRYDFQYEITHGYINTLPDISGAFNPEYYNYARFVSAFLQQETKLENIIIVLEKLKCGENINVWNKGVARALKKFIQNGTKSGKYCEHCGAELVYYNGCTTCLGCGQGGKCD